MPSKLPLLPCAILCAILGTATRAAAPGPPAGGAAAIASGSGTAIASGGAAAPRLLSATGLYAADGSIDPRNMPFSPQYPLWSDGADKTRWIHLPAGTKIDISAIDAWRFPVGTKLWKEFAWGGRKVETRMIWKTGPDAWVFATYAWSDDQKDAVLAPEAGIPDVIAVAPGKRHSLPSVTDCKACHASSAAIVLGFTALQLSDDRDPLAPHAEPLPPGAATLRSLLAAGRLTPQRADLALRPPRIRTSDPTARAALGYLSANCGGCHNRTGALARLDLDLFHDVGGSATAPEPALATAIDTPGRYRMPGIPPAESRVVAPGAPERSTLLYRMQSRRPSSQMPPLGTAVADREAVDLVRRWIAAMPPAPATPAAIAAGRVPPGSPAPERAGDSPAAPTSR